MKVGFTGTRNGMSAAQSAALISILRLSKCELHHGDCVGSDMQAHSEAGTLGYRTVAHPAHGSLRAGCMADEIRTPKPPLERNRDIVDETELLIAVPATADEVLRSGTWSTIRYARKLDRKIFIIQPNGEAYLCSETPSRITPVSVPKNATG